MHLEQISSLPLPWTPQRQGPGAPAWNYATLLEYAPTVADKDSEDTYLPLASVVLADDSLVVCVNLSPQPLHLRLRRYRGDATAPPHRSTLGQGDAFVVPQAMLPLLEVAVSDPALAEATVGACAVETGAMLMMLHSAHTFTHYTRAEVQTILHSPSFVARHGRRQRPWHSHRRPQRAPRLVPVLARRAPREGTTRADHSRRTPALGIKTVVHASPHVCQLQGILQTYTRAHHRSFPWSTAGGRHGRRFVRNPGQALGHRAHGGHDDRQCVWTM